VYMVTGLYLRSYWGSARSFGALCLVVLANLAVITGTLSCAVESAFAQGSAGQDVTGDGQVNILAFGDSITYGVGDGNSSGSYVESIEDSGDPRGYPLRLSSSGSWLVTNAGVPGERLLNSGIERFADLVVGSDIDTIVFMMGTNDAIQRVSASEYRPAVQRLINVARAEGKQMVLNTVVPPTAINSSLLPYTNLYSTVLRDLGAINDLPVADVELRFLTMCPDLSTCTLLNIPEGIHPNTAGYDVMVELIRAALNG
jgi:lysophospholipase L1-like esterase